MRRTAGVLAGTALWVAVAADAVAQDDAESDRAALEALYHATGGDGWADNTNWLSDRPLADWFGVEALPDGRVTGLRLGGWNETLGEDVDNGLTGSLPSELGMLSELRWIAIVGNHGLTGDIPVELGGLTRLEEIILQANSLTGPIPAALGRLTNLSRLLLGSNPLSGLIPRELGDLAQLTSLEFGHTMLSGPLPDSLTRLSALDWLELGGSGLCVPDTPAVRAWLATITSASGAMCVGSLTFLRVVTPPDRADDRVLRYSETGQYWRHVGTDFVDVDNDGDLDLALGHISGPEYVPYSIVLVNDGTGHYPSRILLPHPAFNGGHTAVHARLPDSKGRHRPTVPRRVAARPGALGTPGRVQAGTVAGRLAVVPPAARLYALLHRTAHVPRRRVRHRAGGVDAGRLRPGDAPGAHFERAVRGRAAGARGEGAGARDRARAPAGA